ncbi:MAG: hypothetical protein HONBIEJF_01406 [Fimbriimonadaceae bacterium]|nr:hypothetical protein [Fimbriimonadaceae bacterium]
MTSGDAPSPIKPEALQLLAEKLREREFAAYGLPLNLQVLGYLGSAIPLPALYALVLFFILHVFGIVLRHPYVGFFGLTGEIFCLYWIITRRKRLLWIGVDGSNRHPFAVHAEPVAWWRHLAVVHLTNEVVWTEFLVQPIMDPNLGELQCNFIKDEPAAWSGQELVFRIQNKPTQLPAKVEPASLKAWKGERRVLADPRLHPDTVEALVERYVLTRDEGAKRNYMINRHFERAEPKHRGS